MAISTGLSERFKLQLTKDLVEWIDEILPTFSEENLYFGEPVNFDEIIEGNSSWVAGGQMLPDTLPILGNGAGDFLCLRFGGNGQLRECVAWSHEGCFWEHRGNTIPESLAYDRLVDEQGVVSAVPQEKGKDEKNSSNLSPLAYLQVNCRTALFSKLEKSCLARGGVSLAKVIGVAWQQFSAWLHDPSTMPGDLQTRLSRHLGLSPADLVAQDWGTAISCADAAMKLRPDLSWPYAVAGWGKERQGDIPGAVQIYAKGIFALGSSSAFTQNWTVSPSIATQKFCVQRLLALHPSGLTDDALDYLKHAKERKIREYWLTRAGRAAQAHDPATQYQYLYSAGWDDYYSNGIQEILNQMLAAANEARMLALGALGDLHFKACV